MTFHKDFFHKAISEIRKEGYSKMIITGGPHPTTSFKEVLKDKNIDLCVLGEGEATLKDLVEKLILTGDQKYLNYDELIKVNGIAFSQEKFKPNLNLTEAISS